MDFSLFRIKVFRPQQKEIFATETPSPDILRAALIAKPTDQSLTVRWHIGNIEELGPDALYFALGRAGRTKGPVLDDSTGDFAETEFDSAPYTHVLVDIPHEIAAIAHKSSLAADVTTLANRLEKLLARTEVAARESVTFHASPISRPDEFIRELQEAYAITSFTVYFTRPNPIDVDGDFLEPMERLTQEANGTKGSTTLRGPSLSIEPLTQLTRSAAATGDNATAQVRLNETAKPVKRSLKDDTAKIVQDSVDTQEDRQSLLGRLRSTYARIRGIDEPA